MIQDKAQFAVNGCSLNKNCNAVLSYLWVSLRARREAVICRCRLRAPTLIKQKCNLLNLLTTHFDCLLRDSAAPPAVWGLLVHLLERTRHSLQDTPCS